MATKPGEAICSAQCAAVCRPSVLLVFSLQGRAHTAQTQAQHSPDYYMSTQVFEQAKGWLQYMPLVVGGTHAHLCTCTHYCLPQVPQPSVRPVLQPTSVALWPRICHLSPTMTATTARAAHKDTVRNAPLSPRMMPNLAQSGGMLVTSFTLSMRAFCSCRVLSWFGVSCPTGTAVSRHESPPRTPRAGEANSMLRHPSQAQPLVGLVASASCGQWCR